LQYEFILMLTFFSYHTLKSFLFHFDKLVARKSHSRA
jgi:hypothetical protein